MRDQGCSYGRNRMSKVWIGTSGWTYDGWRGPFYPSDLAKKNWLCFYSHQFPTAEINGVVLSHAVAGGREGVARPDPGDFSVRMEGVEVHHSLEATERELREFDRPDGDPAQGCSHEYLPPTPGGHRRGGCATSADSFGSIERRSVENGTAVLRHASRGIPMASHFATSASGNVR